GVLARAALELLQQGALLLGQPPRDLDVHEHALVPASEALQHGHAAPSQDPDLPRLRARLELELGLAVERRHPHGRAQRGVRHRQVDRGEDVVSLAHEARVRADPDLDVEIPCLSAERARMALARKPDLLAVVDSGRDLDVERSFLDDPAGAFALVAGVLDDAAGATTAGARLGADEFSECGPGDV